MTLPKIYMAMFFFMFCYIIWQKMKKNLVMEIYGWVVYKKYLWIQNWGTVNSILPPLSDPQSIIFQSNFQCHFGHYGRKDFQGTKWNQGYDCGQIESTHYNHVRPRCRYVSKVKRRLLYRGSLLNISKLIWNNVIPKNVSKAIIMALLYLD